MPSLAAKEKSGSCSDARDASWEILESLSELVNLVWRGHPSWSICGVLSQGHWMLYTLSLRVSRARDPSKLSSTADYLKTLGLGNAESG